MCDGEDSESSPNIGPPADIRMPKKAGLSSPSNTVPHSSMSESDKRDRRCSYLRQRRGSFSHMSSNNKNLYIHHVQIPVNPKTAN